MLQSYASNSIFLVSRKDIFHKGFLELSRQLSGRVAVAKTCLCLTLYFGGNDGALLPRLARLLTSPSPLKGLVLKFPIATRCKQLATRCSAIRFIKHYIRCICPWYSLSQYIWSSKLLHSICSHRICETGPQSPPFPLVTWSASGSGTRIGDI